MSSSYHVSPGASKEEKYLELIPQLEASLSVHDYSISTLANVAAALKSVFGFFWVTCMGESGDVKRNAGITSPKVKPPSLEKHWY